jgi:hypothetical protein
MTWRMVVAMMAAVAVGLLILYYTVLRPPQKLTIETLQLSRVRWCDNETIDHLKGRTVIAVGFTNNARGTSNPDQPVTWSTITIRNDPQLIERIVDALAKAKHVEHPMLDLYWSLSLMLLICDDNTGVRLAYNPEWDRHFYYGFDWESKELWDIFRPSFSDDSVRQKFPWPSPGPFGSFGKPGKKRPNDAKESPASRNVPSTRPK